MFVVLVPSIKHFVPAIISTVTVIVLLALFAVGCGEQAPVTATARCYGVPAGDTHTRDDIGVSVVLSFDREGFEAPPERLVIQYAGQLQPVVCVVGAGTNR